MPHVSTFSPRALIVGAGIAGCCTAITLSAQGWNVELIERQSEWRFQSSGIFVYSNGLSALREVDTAAGWLLFAGLIGAGLLAVTGLMRVGMRHFWVSDKRAAPRLRVAETLPIALLLGAACAMVLMAEPVLDYTRAAAEALHDPVRYIDAVMGARIRPPGAGS